MQPPLQFDRVQTPPVMERIEDRRAFRDRFRHPAWNRFLRLVIRELGSAAFAGVMTPFHRNPDLVVGVTACRDDGRNGSR